MKLRPYHNPKNLDESLVPAGWRLAYLGEATPTTKGRFLIWNRNWSVGCYPARLLPNLTLILPVTA
jgi:hypothetical protein